MQPIVIQPESAVILAATTVALFVKGVALSYLQVRVRVSSRRFARDEDARLMGVASAPEPDIIERINGAWRNELENGPIFLALAASYVLLGGSSGTFFHACSGFVVARVLQSWAQICAMQPLRTIAFLAGLAATLALAALVIMLIWSAQP